MLGSADGQMTTSHVVHALDEMTVEFLGGETVMRKVVASEPAADLSLLRTPPGRASHDVAALHGGPRVLQLLDHDMRHTVATGARKTSTRPGA